MPRPSIWLAEAASGFDTRRIAVMKDSDLCIVFLVSVVALMLIGLTRDAVEPTWQPDNDAPVIMIAP
jgi:hypothetical protein